MNDIVKKNVNVKVFRPQPGPQELYFTKYWTNVVIYGGAVFSGKTYALALDAIYDSKHTGFESKIFRRSYPQIMQSLIPTCREIYSGIRYMGYAEKPNPIFKFYDDPKKKKKRSEVSFGHLLYEKNLEDQQGLQSPFIGFDELEHFSKSMFTYMFSRNRSRVPMPPSVNTQRIRASCNPLPGSWLADLLDQGGYIQQDGYPDPGMSGKTRYMYHINDEWVFGNDPVSMQKKYHMEDSPFSLAFVPGNISDNILGNKANKFYSASLRALSDYDYDVLVRGNWKKVRQGSIILNEFFFSYEESDVTENIDLKYKIITVDTAQGIGQQNDNTVFLCSGMTSTGKFILLDCLVGKFKPMETYRIAQAFYIKHNKPTHNIINPKTGAIKTYQSAPLMGMAIEYANRGIDLLMNLKDKGYKVMPIKRQGKVAEGQRSNDKVARTIAVLPYFQKSGIGLPSVPTRHSGYDQWCNNDPDIQKVLELGESVCTDPKLWTLSMKSELLGFSQGANKKEVAGQSDDRVDVTVDAINMLQSKNLSWVQSLLNYGK